MALEVDALGVTTDDVALDCAELLLCEIALDCELERKTTLDEGLTDELETCEAEDESTELELTLLALTFSVAATPVIPKAVVKIVAATHFFLLL